MIKKSIKNRKKLAFKYALNDKASNGRLFIIDTIQIDSGKTKDAKAFVEKLFKLTKTVEKRDKPTLFVVDYEKISEESIRAFNNYALTAFISYKSLSTDLIADWSNIVVQKAVFEKLIEQNQ